MHLLNQQLFETCSFIHRYYDFKLTADNIDLNGIIDLEDYQEHKNSKGRTIQKSICETDVLTVLSPYLHIFYSVYSRVGCYFISQPIYAEKPHLKSLLTQYRNAIDTPDNCNIKRPSFTTFCRFLHLETYLGIKLPENASEITFPKAEFKLPKHIVPHIYPISTKYLDIIEIDTSITYSETPFYIKCKYQDHDKHDALLLHLSKLNTVYLYITDHPHCYVYQHHYNDVVKYFWAKSLYDSNVNLMHYDLCNKILTEKHAEFPFMGKMPAVCISDCQHPDCIKIPKDIKGVYELGYAHTLLRSMDALELKIAAYNPLLVLDRSILDLGRIDNKNIYFYPPRLQINYLINYHLLDYFEENGINVVLPPSSLDNEDDIQTTYTSKYYIRQPTVEAIYADLKLFEDNEAGSMSINTLLMSSDIVSCLYRENVLNSNNLPNIPTTIFDVNILRKHKSSGIPYCKHGDNGFMMNLYGLSRQDLINHKKHSFEQSITLVINKLHLETKARVRTILAININLSEQGRCCFRFILEKIKASARNGGPCLIGFSPQHHGWDSVYTELDGKFRCSEYAKRASKDFPKYDRRVTPLLLYMSALLFYEFVDPITLQNSDLHTQEEIFNLFMSEATQVIYNYLVALGHIFVKAGGQTSGGSRTADGNTMVHTLLDYAAVIEELIVATDTNRHILRELRDNIAQTLWDLPANYNNTLYIYNHWRNFPKPEIFPIPHSTLDEFYAEHGAFYTIIHCIKSSKHLSDDSVMNYNSALIDYNSFLKHFNLFSNYHFTHDKYHIDTLDRGAHEFLSQETFEYYGYFFPKPDMERILASLITTYNNNVHDITINNARIIALFSVFYPVKYTNGNIKEKRLLDVLRSYIVKYIKNVDLDTINDLNLGMPLEKFSVDTLDDDLDELYGFDKARENPKVRNVYQNHYNDLADQRCITVEAHTLNFCVICEQPSCLTCVCCDLAFCNDGTNTSHVMQHLNSTEHFAYKHGSTKIACKTCLRTDIRNLQFYGNTFYCSKHMPPLLTNNAFSNGAIIFNSSSASINYSELQLDLIIRFNKTFSSRDWRSCIKTSMDLLWEGICRPYFYLVLYLANIEDQTKKLQRINIPYLRYVLRDNNIYDFIVAPSVKYDERSTYLITDSKGKSTEVKFTVTYDGQSNHFIWSTHCNTNITGIVCLPFNILETAIKALSIRTPHLLRYFTRYSHNAKVNDSSNVIYYNYNHYDQFPGSTKSILQTINKHFVSFVQGPPGTGKTYNASHLLKILYDNNLKLRFLILAPSHKAVDVIFHAFCSLFQRLPFDIVRVHHDTDNIRSPYKRNYVNIANQNHRVVFSTIQAQSVGVHPYHFILTDESSQQADLYIFCCLSRLLKGGSIVFFGDSKQLSCVDDYRTSICYGNLPNFVSTFAQSACTDNYVMLTDHFRSHPQICKFVSEFSYDGKLNCKTDINKLKYCQLITQYNDNRIFRILINSEISSFDKGIYYSQGEIDSVKILLKEHLNNNVRQGNVAILCTYKSQYFRMREAITEYCSEHNITNVDVHTIDSVQGDQYDHVIIAFTKFNSFTLDHNRLNVAFSRARSTLFLLIPFKRHLIPDIMAEQPILELQNSIIAESIKQIPYENYINLRSLYDISHERYFDYSFKHPPFKHDYVTFDAEFMNIKKQHGSNRALMLSYSLYNSDNIVDHSYLVTGRPVFYDEDFKPTYYDLKLCDLQFVKQNPELYKLQKQLYSKALEGQYCDPKHILTFCLNFCVTGPVFVLWSGRLDLPFLIPLIQPITNTCVNCGNQAFYYSSHRNQCYCQLHANKNKQHITHFTRLRIINLCSDARNGIIYTGNNNITLSFVKRSAKSQFNLVECHDQLDKLDFEGTVRPCDTIHGIAHDPSADVKYTHCILQRLIFEQDVLHEIDQNLQSIYYQPDITVKRHKVIDFVLKRFHGRKICNLGCGNKLHSVAMHHVDIIPRDNVICADMNYHDCDADILLFLDSIYYYNKPLQKPAIIFYDANKDHYANGVDGRIYYKCGRGYIYQGYYETSDDVIVTDLFSTFEPCSGKQSLVRLKTPILPCNTSSGNDTYTICATHLEQLDIITDIAELVKFGYRFLFLQPVVKESSNIPDYQTKPLDIPGYLTRRPQNQRNTIKGRELTSIFLQQLVTYKNLPSNCAYMFFGARGYTGSTPICDEFFKFFLNRSKNIKLNYILVDPGFELIDKANDNYKYYDTTIKNYKHDGSPIFFVLCDAYNSDATWFYELQTFINSNHIVNGAILMVKFTQIAFMKIGYQKISELFKNFKFFRIYRLTMAGPTSEVWFVGTDYSNTCNNNYLAAITGINLLYYKLEKGLYCDMDNTNISFKLDKAFVPWAKTS